MFREKKNHIQKIHAINTILLQETQLNYLSKKKNTLEKNKSHCGENITSLDYSLKKRKQKHTEAVTKAQEKKIKKVKRKGSELFCLRELTLPSRGIPRAHVPRQNKQRDKSIFQKAKGEREDTKSNFQKIKKENLSLVPCPSRDPLPRSL